MTSKKKNDSLKEPETPKQEVIPETVPETVPEVPETVTNKTVPRTLITAEEFNEAFSGKIDLDCRRTDVLRFRRDLIFKSSIPLINEILVEFGKIHCEENKNVFLEISKSFIIIWEVTE